jgi:hypothetical protein
MATVYLLSQPTVSATGDMPNLRPLAAFGAIRTLVQTGNNPLHRPLETLELIRRRLADFNPNEDYLVAAGGGALAALLVGVALAELDIPRVCWLSFRKHPLPGHYEPMWLELVQHPLPFTMDDTLDTHDE